MILDANVLLYAVDETSRHHDRASGFLEQHLNGAARVGLPWQSISAFLRISTHPRIMTTPLAPAFAVACVDDWLAAPAAWLPDVTKATWSIMRTLVVDADISGNLVPDAQLASLALQHGAQVVSADSDFARFRGVRWLNPFD